MAVAALFVSHPNKLCSLSSLPFSPSQWQLNKKTATAVSFLPIKLYSSPKPLTLAMNQQQQQPKYVYPDPIPEFARAETQKFRSELLKKLLKDKDTFGNNMDEIADVCAEKQIFSNFLHTEYGGPGTLLVEPFTDMLLALKAKKLPGAPAAARAALLWAQNYVDHDWEIWTSQHSS
ncbi:hypothetical protein ACLOJK_030978 [Asimina triloba]